MKYKVIIRESDQGYSVSCPGLPGCWSEGKTENEAILNIKDAIQEHLAAITAFTRDEDVREIEVAS